MALGLRIQLRVLWCQRWYLPSMQVERDSMVGQKVLGSPRRQRPHGSDRGLAQIEAITTATASNEETFLLYVPAPTQKPVDGQRPPTGGVSGFAGALHHHRQRWVAVQNLLNPRSINLELEATPLKLEQHR
jgi:hypothetical protein